jgi:uncharacterized protein YjbI with pentapeptide repeats
MKDFAVVFFSLIPLMSCNSFVILEGYEIPDTSTQLVILTKSFGPFSTIAFGEDIVVSVKGDFPAGTEAKLTLSLGDGELSGNLLATIDNGFARFTNVSISTPGKKKLKVNLSSLSAESESFELIPRPDPVLIKTDTTPGVFCPRLELQIESVPAQAQSMCWQMNDEELDSCTFIQKQNSFVFRAEFAAEATAYIWYKDANEHIIGSTHHKSNTLTFPSSALPQQRSQWLQRIQSQNLSNSEWDEFLCRVDELNEAEIKVLSDIRENSGLNQRKKLSQEFSKIISNKWGIAASVDIATTQQALWRLMTSTDAIGIPLAELDLSRADFTGRTLSQKYRRNGKDIFVGFDLSGSNIKGHQLNGISTNSSMLKLAGVDLSGWVPDPDLSLFGVDLSGAQNIPWNVLNQRTHEDGLAYARLSDLDLSQWEPVGGLAIYGIDLSDSTSIPWSLLNNNSHAFGYRFMNFTGLDLTHWSPAIDSDLSFITFTQAQNLPWGILNTISHRSGLRGSVFKQLNLSGFVPPVTMDISMIDLRESTNIPWSEINSNEHYNYHRGLNLSGLNVSQWIPSTTRRIDRVQLVQSQNIPWSTLNDNTHAAYVSGMNLSGLNLASWNPATARRIDHINLENATQIPWAAINANSHSYGYVGMDFTGLDVSQFNPNAARDISYLNLSESSGIPWAVLHNNSNSSGYMGLSFAGIDLASFAPAITKNLFGIDYRQATNVPWGVVENNTTALGFAGSYVNASDIAGLSFAGNTPIWGMDLSAQTSVPWDELNSNTHALSKSYMNFNTLDVKDLNPDSQSLAYTRMPNGVLGVSDFEERTERQIASGTQWTDCSYPRGSAGATHSVKCPVEPDPNGLIVDLRSHHPDSYPSSGRLWRDLSGHEHHAFITGTSAYDATNSVLNFGGNASSMAANIHLNMKTNAATFLTWFRTSEAAAYMFIFNKGCLSAQPNINNGITVFLPNWALGTLWIGANKSQGDNMNALTAHVGQNFRDGAWYNLAVRFEYNGTHSILKSFINGVERASGQQSGDYSEFFNLTTALTLGRGCGGSSLNGQLASHQIYDRALNSDEIMEIYERERQQFTP